VAKHSLCASGPLSVAHYWYRENWYPSEVTFVEQAQPKSEDDGWLVFIALEGEQQNSHFVVLNATTMEEVSITSLGFRVTFTAHGQFFSPTGPEPSV
jgi:carotenoid cleavage dioxygenase-like enzyme